MAIGLSEAAAATGVNRSTIYRAWKAGRLSATRTDTGQIEVEPAELFRVFPPIASQQSARCGALRHNRWRWRRRCVA
jgi:excisionase family DNA binding protein